MTEYYFIASLLPELQIGHIPALNFKELKMILAENLTKEDRDKIKDFLHFLDYENLRALWNDDPLDKRGNFNKEELSQAILNLEWPDGKEFPDYLCDFLQKYRDDEDRVKHFFWLMSRFLDDQIEHQEGFLQQFYRFEKEMRLILVGFRAKQFKKDVTKELQYEDPSDPIVAQILAQKDVKEFEPPYEYRELKSIFEEFGNRPLELQQALWEYYFSVLIEITGNEHFSIDRILGYIARLLVVENWLKLNVQEGLEIVDDIVRKVQ